MRCLSEPGFGGIFGIYMINSQFIYRKGVWKGCWLLIHLIIIIPPKLSDGMKWRRIPVQTKNLATAREVVGARKKHTSISNNLLAQHQQRRRGAEKSCWLLIPLIIIIPPKLVRRNEMAADPSSDKKIGYSMRSCWCAQKTHINFKQPACATPTTAKGD